MADNAQTLNDQGGAADAGAPSSGAQYPQTRQVGDLISTKPEFPMSEPGEKKDGADNADGAKNTSDTQPADDGQDQSGKDTGDQGSKPGDKADGSQPKGDEFRFDRHPRFQELRSQLKEATEKIAQLEKAGQQKAAQDDTRDSKPDYVDVTTMGKEQLQDMLDDDPTKFFSNLAKQINHEITQGVDEKVGEVLKRFDDFEKSQEEKEQFSAVEKTYNDFAEKNPDFDEMWEKGTLTEFMEQNPGHNAMSAYYALTADQKQKAAIEKALKEKEDALSANARAKAGARTLGAGPSTGGRADQVADEIRNPAKYGGNTAVLADQLRKFREGR